MSARAPIVIVASPTLLEARHHRLSEELQILQAIQLSSPLVRALIVPSELQKARFFSAFLSGSGRGIDIRYYHLSPSPTDYGPLLEAHYDALLEQYALQESTAGDLSEVTLIRSELSKKLIELIAKDRRSLEMIEWRELEYLVAEVFERLGFSVELTPSSKDGGKDIVLTSRAGSCRCTYYVEIKHWRSGKRVGRKAVREFLNIVVKDELTAGLYLSTSGYCLNSVESLTEIERRRIRFGTESKVIAMCKTYVKANAGLWTLEEPSHILYTDTF